MTDHIAFYRKYRPQQFSDVLGQDHIKRTLANAIATGKISHAYLFCGPRGSGKTSTARLFAKAINCSYRKNLTANKLTTNNKPITAKSKQKLEVSSEQLEVASAEPCGSCISCQEIAAGKSLDLIEIDAASHTGVDEVRELIETVKFSPVSSPYKVFIIDECHQLSKAAANALLKTLEEPPVHAVFILATTEAHKMIPTIVSRCQRFDFKRVAGSEIVHKLQTIAKEEGFSLEPQAAQLISWQARGSFRDAESLLDSCVSFAGNSKTLTAEKIKEMLGIVEMEEAGAFVELLIRKDAKNSVAVLAKLTEQGTDLHEFAKQIVAYLRQVLLMKINPATVAYDAVGALAPEAELKMKSLAETAQEVPLRNMLERFVAAENQMKYATIPQLPLELAIVDITY